MLFLSKSCPGARRVLPIALLLLALGGPAIAHAGTAEEADAALARGVELRRKGDAEKALAELQKAYELVPTGQAAAQLGLAHQSLGHWPDAAEKLEEALKAGASEPWIRKNRGALEKALAFVHEHVGTIEVAGTPAGASVLIEGRPVGKLPLAGPAFAPAGAVALEVRQPGYLPVVRNTIITSGQLSRETVELRALPPPEVRPVVVDEGRLSRVAPPSAPTRTPSQGAGPSHLPRSGNVDDTSPGDSTRVLAWAATGMGAALVLTTIIATVERSSDSRDLSGKLSSGACTQMGSDYSGPAAADCVDLATGKDRWTYVAIGAAIGSVAAGTAAVVLFSFSRAGGGDGSSTPTRTAVIVPSRDGATLRVGWTF